MNRKLISSACILAVVFFVESARNYNTINGDASLCLTATVLYAQSAGSSTPVYYNKGDKLNVISEAGLTVRQSPDIKASRLTVVPLAGSVIAGEDAQRVPFSVGGIQGYWIAVMYEGKSGFAFDGFLSLLPAPKKCDPCDFNKVFEEYLDRSLKMSGSPSTRSEGMFQYTEKRYSNGFVLKKKEGEEGLPEFSLEIDMPRTRVSEAFLLCRLTGFYMLKDVSFSSKSSRRDIDGYTGEKITVKEKGGVVDEFKLERTDKVSGGGGIIEFIRKPSGTLMRYNAWGS